MIFDVYDATTSQWIDFTPIMAYQSFEGSRNDVDGPNAGRVIQNAMMERDRLATKYKFTFTSIPQPNEVISQYENYLMPEFFYVRTDYYTPGTATVYECYSNNVTKAHVIHRATGEDLVKITAPIVEK